MDRTNIYTIVWFLTAPHWNIGPTAMSRAAVTPIYSAFTSLGCYWLWQPPEALQEGWYTSLAREQNHAIIIITIWSHDVSSFCKPFMYSSVSCGALIQSQILFVSPDRVDRSSLACARTWERTLPNNGHHVVRSSNQREAFLIAPATKATPILP